MSALTKLEAIEKSRRMEQLTKEVNDLENRLRFGIINSDVEIQEKKRLMDDKKREIKQLKMQLWDCKPETEDED